MLASAYLRSLNLLSTSLLTSALLAVACLFAFPTRAVSVGAGDGSCNDGAVIVLDGQAPPPESGSKTGGIVPAPFAPGGGSGGTIGSLPTLIKELASLLGGLPPSLFGASNSGVPGVINIGLPAPPKADVLAYGWVVNGITIFGGPVNKVGPVLYFPASDLKFAMVTTESLNLVFFGQDLAPVMTINIDKIFQ